MESPPIVPPAAVVSLTPAEPAAAIDQALVLGPAAAPAPAGPLPGVPGAAAVATTAAGPFTGPATLAPNATFSTPVGQALPGQRDSIFQGSGGSRRTARPHTRNREEDLFHQPFGLAAL